MLAVASAELKGVAGGLHRILVGDGGLDGELIPFRVLTLPLGAYLFDDAAELMAHDGGMLGNIFRHALMVGALDGRLVAGHTDRVGNHLYQNFVVFNLRQFKGIQPQIVLPVQTHRFVQHAFSSLIFRVYQEYIHFQASVPAASRAAAAAVTTTAKAASEAGGTTGRRSETAAR